MHCDNLPGFNYWAKERMDDVDSAVADSRSCSPAQYSFVLLGLLGRLGDLAWSGRLLVHTLNHAHCHRLTHVTYSKAPWERKNKLCSFFFTLRDQVDKRKRGEGWSPYRGEDTQKSSRHTWACLGSCPQWRHRQTWVIWGCLLVSSLNDDRSSLLALQTCKRYGLCGSPALGHSQR